MRKPVALALVLVLVPAAHAAPQWTEGTHYFRILPAQPSSVAEGKVEVTEAFSYGCPACNHYLPVMDRLEANLPANAELTYVPASWNPREQWPLFQRAYYAATALGVDEEAHLAMFEAVWATGELAVVDRQTRRLKRPPPTIEDVARFYASRTDVTEEQFLDAARSFSVDLNMKRADHWIQACRIDRTPSFVVNGKYRLHEESAGGVDELIKLVNWLVAKESNTDSGAGGRASP